MITATALDMARRGYGWEDICVALKINWHLDRDEIREMVLRRTWRGREREIITMT